MFPLMICVAVYATSALFLRTAIAHAPEAFEDEGGFHLGHPPLEQYLAEAA